MKILEDKIIKEKVYIHKYGNGLELLIIPKKGFINKLLMFGTRFGSIDNKFVINGEKVELPDGIAHFLEHKVFEEKDNSVVLAKLSALGALTNAYTTYDHTTYFFDTIDNYEECAKILFKCVQSPHFSEDGINNERDVITQELQMYNDDENSKVYMNLLESMYSNHPIRIDIGGTVDSVKNIDKDILYKCYNSFYNVSNMVVCVCGDVDIDETISFIGSLIPNKIQKVDLKKLSPVEQKKILQKKIVAKMDIHTPLLAIGFKDSNISLRNNDERIKYDISVQIVMDMLLGKSSNLYKELYYDNLLPGRLTLEYLYVKDVAYAIMQMSTTNPELVIEKLKNEMKSISFDENTFQRIRKTLYGEYIKEFNSISNIGMTVFADYMRGINTLDYSENYEKISFDDVKQVFNELFTEENMCVSIVEKKEK
ncbi:MAG: pitrilysin family protein [Clostridia bacterium]|nr:pitrilysin family protein [Clostridia bacterium]